MNPASGIQEVIEHETPSKVVIEYKPKYDANDPRAPLEVAVLDAMKDGPVIIPILSVPVHPDQFSVNRDSPSEEITEEFNEIDRQELDLKTKEEVVVINGEKIVIHTVENFGSNEEIEAAEKALEEEKARMRMYVVAEYNHMSSIPDKWVDSKGNKFIPVDGGNLLDGVVGGAVGFRLKETDVQKHYGHVVLNRPEGFSARRNVPDNEWKRWPELSRELSNWGNKQLSECSGKAGCKEAIDWLLAIDHIKGEAREYTLSDGGKLRHVQGGARATKAVLEKCMSECTDGDVADEMKFHLWISVQKDGTVRVLHGGDSFYSGIDSVTLVDHYCDSQCGAAWTEYPSVVSAKGQTFIVGHYSGGTLSGYLVYQVLPDELRVVGRFAWGS